VIDQRRTMADVARQLGVVEPPPGNWVRQERIDRGMSEGLSNEDRARITELDWHVMPTRSNCPTTLLGPGAQNARPRPSPAVGWSRRFGHREAASATSRTSSGTPQLGGSDSSKASKWSAASRSRAGTKPQ
jgi:hypothetical protein